MLNHLSKCQICQKIWFYTSKPIFHNKSKIISHQKSTDNTIKYAIQLYDGLVIESVLIPLMIDLQRGLQVK